MSGFASGLNAGMSAGMNVIKLYQQAAQRKAIDNVNAQTPEVSQGYTAEQGEQLRAMAEAKDPNGVPYYNVQADEGGRYYAIPNPAAQGFEGADTTRGQPAMSPGTVTDYLGTRVQGEMTPTQMRGLKRRALADAVMPYDVARGSKMMADADEYEDGAQLRQVQVAEANAKLRGLERQDAFQAALDAAGKMDADQVNTFLMGNQEALAGMGLGLTPAEGGGYTLDLGGGNKTAVTPMQARGLAIGGYLMKNGFTAEGLAQIIAVDKDAYGKWRDSRNHELEASKAAATTTREALRTNAYVETQRTQADYNRARTAWGPSGGAKGSGGAATPQPQYKGATVDRNGKVSPSPWARQETSSINAQVREGTISQEEGNRRIQNVQYVDTNWSTVKTLARAFKANPDQVQEGVEKLRSKGYTMPLIQAAMQEAGVSAEPRQTLAQSQAPRSALPPPRTDSKASPKPTSKTTGDFYSDENSAKRKAEQREQERKEAEAKAAERKKREEERDRWAAGIKTTMQSRQERERSQQRSALGN